MTKNRASPKTISVPLIGPRKPRQPSDPAVREVMLNDRTGGVGGGFERPLPAAVRPY
jgi:hypothetical protein